MDGCCSLYFWDCDGSVVASNLLQHVEHPIAPPASTLHLRAIRITHEVNDAIQEMLVRNSKIDLATKLWLEDCTGELEQTISIATTSMCHIVGHNVVEELIVEGYQISSNVVLELSEKLQKSPSLKRLSLDVWTANCLDRDCIVALARSIQHGPSLTHLTLRNIMIDVNSIHSWKSSLAACSSLEHLNVSECCFDTPSHVQQLVDSLNGHATLRSFRMDSNDCRDSNVTDSLCTLITNPRNSLLSLDLSFEDSKLGVDEQDPTVIPPLHISTIAKSLASTTCSLKELRLSRNFLSSEDISFLVAAFVEGTGLIETLDLACCDVQGNQLVRLSFGLAHLLKLKNLFLSYNPLVSEEDFDMSGIQELIKVVSAHPSLYFVSLEGVQGIPLSTQEELYYLLSLNRSGVQRLLFSSNKDPSTVPASVWAMALSFVRFVGLELFTSTQAKVSAANFGPRRAQAEAIYHALLLGPLLYEMRAPTHEHP